MRSKEGSRALSFHAHPGLIRVAAVSTPEPFCFFWLTTDKFWYQKARKPTPKCLDSIILSFMALFDSRNAYDLISGYLPEWYWTTLCRSRDGYSYRLPVFKWRGSTGFFLVLIWWGSSLQLQSAHSLSKTREVSEFFHLISLISRPASVACPPKKPNILLISFYSTKWPIQIRLGIADPQSI